jgi:hypothetical protein
MTDDLVRNPGPHDHFVQLYQKLDGLADAVAEYIGAGLSRGEGAVVIATPEHRAAFLDRLGIAERSRVKVLDAEQTLATFMVGGLPQWQAFQQVIGGLIAEMRLQFPTVRAYGEMVDLLWQRGEREAAIRLEEFWNELGKLQTFSLFCAYRMDPLESAAYAGPLESVCRAHSHLIPARDTARFDAAVRAAARPDPARARRGARQADAHAGGPGGAVLAQAEHAAHRREGAQGAAGRSFASRLISAAGS